MIVDILSWIVAALLILLMLQSIAYRWVRKQPDFHEGERNGTTDATNAIAEGRDAKSGTFDLKNWSFAYLIGYSVGWHTTFGRHNTKHRRAF